ncbi:acyl-CoA dehydrogenase family protein [Thalassovita sp.]|uniref:acyl-CoA dehydrogenase family protein n=1 Tax=Thalassovita sp. TaxID=1979401 RepID=UPI0029DE8761|nr:acyl-CoA dehydrogenase family protein [Thalassovita sp.]
MLAPLPLSVIPPEDEAIRAEVRAFARKAVESLTPVQRAQSWMGFSPELSQQMAERGWLGLSIKKDYGGQEAGFFRRLVIVEEMLAAGAPVFAHWIADRQSGPLIQRFGSEVQKRRYLPGICAGQSFYCIGMSEPGAGSDLASVRTRATKVPGGWRLNGQKIWTTHAPRCDHMIALVRSSGQHGDRHAGLSQFVVDLNAAGVTIRAIPDLAGNSHFSEVFFDDVFLPDDTLIGVEGDGWAQVTAELAFERTGPERILSSITVLQGWMDWLRSQGAAETGAIGRWIGHLAVLRELTVSLTARLAAGENPALEAALVKDLGTTFEQDLASDVLAALTDDPGAAPPADLLAATSYVVQVAPTFSLRGGTREILRGMVARGLGLR